MADTFDPATADAMTVDALLDAARAQGLSLTTTQTDFDRTGLDFLVVHATDEAGAAWIVRTPRREDVREAARREARVLAFVAPRLPVAVPEWRVATDDVIAYPRIAGTPAVAVDPERGHSWQIIDPAAPCDAFLDSFARTLAALQACDVDAAAAAGVRVETVAEARARVAADLAFARDALDPPQALWERWRRWLDSDDGWPPHAALVHDDLHPGHMLLAEDGRLIGVLDWTEARVSDPVGEFAMFFGCFGADALEALVARFEAVGGRAWPGLRSHAEERWSAWPGMAAAWALRAGNEGVLAYARGVVHGASG